MSDVFEFKSGRKVIKSVNTFDEANALMRSMIAIRNNDSMWELDESTGHLRAADELEKLVGTVFDIFDTMAIFVNGEKVRRIWAKGF